MIALPHYQGFHVGASGNRFRLPSHPLTPLATPTPNANLPLVWRVIFRGGDPYSLSLSRTSKLCQEPIQIRLRIIRVLIQRNMKFEKAPEYRRYHPLRGQRIISRFPVRAVNLNFLSVFQNGTVYIALVPVLERRSLKPGSVIRKTRPHKTGLQRDAVFLKE